MSEDVVPPGVPGEAPASRRPPKWILAGLLVACVAIAAVVAFVVFRGSDESPPTIQHRPDPLADLLAWIPAGAAEGTSFSGWIADPGVTASSVIDLQQLDQLAIEPIPRTLGRTGAWASSFGWSAANVTGWATIGDGRGLSIFVGEFDETKIASALDRSGYSNSTYRGVRIWQFAEVATPGASVDGDAPAAANVIALLDGRLIVAPQASLVQAAIDTASSGSGSLADHAVVASALERLAPLSGLTGVAQSTFGRQCDPNGVFDGGPPDQYVFVGYGRLGAGGDRRTLVATSFAGESAAEVAATDYEDGWASGFANAGGTGGSLSSFGEISSVSRSGSLLVAEIVNGRDDGWVRSGIRFAQPVCAAVFGSAPAAATPDPNAGLTNMQRIAAALPETGTEGEYLAADVASLSAGRSYVAPDAEAPTVLESAAWQAALDPLPGFTVIPSTAERLSTWATAFNIPLDQIVAVGEARTRSDRAPVGVLIGTWNPDDVDFALKSLGYQSIAIGLIHHYAISEADASANPALVAAGDAWRNVAMFGDRIWVSADQGEMRDVVSLAIGETVADPSIPPIRGALLTSEPGALAAHIAGIDYSAATCSAVTNGISAAAAFWTAGEGESGSVILLAGTESNTLDIENYLDTWAIDFAAGSTESGATPVAVLVEFEYLGTESASFAGTPGAAARFTIGIGTPRPAQFFTASAGSCGLVEAA